MATLSQIVNNTASVTLQVDDLKVTIKYYPRRLTQKVILRFTAMQEDPNALEANFSAINDVLVTLISSWDLYEDEANLTLVPIEASRFADLPISLVAQIIDVIMSSARPETIASQTQN